MKQYLLPLKTLSYNSTTLDYELPILCETEKNISHPVYNWDMKPIEEGIRTEASNPTGPTAILVN